MLGVGYELIETVILLMLVTFLDKRLYNDEHYFKYTLLPCCYRSRNHLDFNEFTDVVNIEMAVISMALPGYNTDFYSLDLSKVCDDNEAVSHSSSSSSSPSSKYTVVLNPISENQMEPDTLHMADDIQDLNQKEENND